jgi:hypothetical protein
MLKSHIILACQYMDMQVFFEKLIGAALKQKRGVSDGMDI